jgi:hypothetical protein
VIPQGKPMLRFRVLLAGEFKEGRGGDEERLLAKCRPSDRKLKTGAPPSRTGGRAKVIRTSSTLSAATDRGVRSLQHPTVPGPPDVLLVVVAHVSECGSAETQRKLPRTFFLRFRSTIKSFGAYRSLGPRIVSPSPPHLSAEVACRFRKQVRR